MEGGKLANSFYDVSITLILRPDNDSTQKLIKGKK